MVTVFWDEKSVLLDFPEGGHTLTSKQYIKILKKLREAIKRKRPNKNLKIIHMHHDYVQTHTTLATNQVIAKFGSSVVTHPPYSPDLAPSDFHLSSPMKDFVWRQQFDDIDEVIVAQKKWIQQCTPTFFQRGFNSWVQ